MKKIETFDSTLRDGAQSEDISFSVNDKINIVKTLDEFGITYIEAGNPASNPKDLEFFEKLSQIELKNSKICAFGSTRRKKSKVEDDANIKALLSTNTSVISIFGKTWDLHVKEVIQTTLEENLEMIYDTIKYFKNFGKEVIFDAEHFFDGYKSNASYAIKVLQNAVDAGADVLCLCDTNGGVLPNEVKNIVSTVVNQFKDVRIGIHAHNDSGCAVANSIISIEEGAVQVQGTFLGFGERCGNADLSAIIPSLNLKTEYICDVKLELITETAKKISGISNIKLLNNKPFVGKSAFAHKAGMHIDGVLKNSKSFEHIDPDLVGNKRRFLISEVAGRGSVLEKIKSFAPEIDKSSPLLSKIIDTLKDLEHKGYQFESSDASFEILVKKILGTYNSHFKLNLYKTMGEFPMADNEFPSYATVKVEVNGTSEMTAASGNGPVNALDTALRKALVVFYPNLSKMKLVDYKVRVLDQKQATAATTRVLIESTNGRDNWTTIGVSTDIIEASIIALIDSIEYFLEKDRV
ncbi:MAG: citramalate synthase [Bacilli bacterium]|nr:citramalate synthase [Bacilli bacterium]